jgi:hypothetical protein
MFKPVLWSFFKQTQRSTVIFIELALDYETHLHFKYDEVCFQVFVAHLIQYIRNRVQIGNYFLLNLYPTNVENWVSS